MIFEDDDDIIGCGGAANTIGAKGIEQVRALEQIFDVENWLELEQKARLAQDLVLQPFQVTVWFQNRHARWKTKPLEHDFSALKSRYDALRLDFDSLRSQLASLKLGELVAPNMREIAHGMLAERALEPILPSEEDFPYTVRVESTITESNGSSKVRPFQCIHQNGFSFVSFLSSENSDGR